MFAETIHAMQHGISAPLPQDFQCLLNRLQEEEYQYISSLCNRVDTAVSDLKQHEEYGRMAAYADRCTSLVTDVRRYMRMRRLVLLPYIQELLDKEDMGHDCRSCGGGCSIRHLGQVNSVRKAHAGIRERLFQVQTGPLPVYSLGAFPEACRALRTHMLLLQTALMELLFIEESALIPRMIELQHNIGAHG
jgi:hypothetical protein